MAGRRARKTITEGCAECEALRKSNKDAVCDACGKKAAAKLKKMKAMMKKASKDAGFRFGV